jgi:AcrR family transcriptional regulator
MFLFAASFLLSAILCRMKHGLAQRVHRRVASASNTAVGRRSKQGKQEVSPRERIMRVAEDLFYRYGIRSVGVDWIIEQSDVAKMTFYKHFPSKSDLIAAYLQRQKERWRQIIDKATSREGSTLDRVLAIFDVLQEMCDAPSYQGCPFIKAMAEFGPDHSEIQIRDCISSHFTETGSTLSELIREMGLPPELSQAIASLVFGAMVIAQTAGEADVVQTNKKAARLLLTGCAAPSQHTPAPVVA